jgi:hypothetical protein
MIREIQHFNEPTGLERVITLDGRASLARNDELCARPEMIRDQHVILYYCWRATM